MEKLIVQVATFVNAKPSVVWHAMTQKETAMFPGTEVVTDWKVGSPISFSGVWKGKRFKDNGEIQAIKEDRELSFTHWSQLSGSDDKPENYHVVRYELAPESEGTKVTLSQYNKGKDVDLSPETKKEFEDNWRMMLDGLKKVAESAV
jgi:uncharacterized protein YndB with AHSA1/START domain